jgi:hypothetical protein
MKRRWHQGSCLMRGLAKGRAAFSVPVLADQLRRGVNLVDLPRLLARLGSAWQGARGGTTARLRMSETRTSSRRPDPCTSLASLIQPSAMSFDTVWRLVRQCKRF